MRFYRKDCKILMDGFNVFSSNMNTLVDDVVRRAHAWLDANGKPEDWDEVPQMSLLLINIWLTNVRWRTGLAKS